MPYDYRCAYEWELGEWDRHRANVTTPIGIATILGGVIGYSLQRFVFESSYLAFLFAGIAALAIASLLVAIYQMVRMLHGHTYKRIPRPDALFAHADALIKWHERNGLDTGLADSIFEAELNRSYASTTSHNALLNAKRSERLFRTNRALIVSSIFTFLLLPLVAYSAYRAGPQPALVRIVNLPMESSHE